MPFCNPLKQGFPRRACRAPRQANPCGGFIHDQFIEAVCPTGTQFLDPMGIGLETQALWPGQSPHPRVVRSPVRPVAPAGRSPAARAGAGARSEISAPLAGSFYRRGTHLVPREVVTPSAGLGLSPCRGGRHSGARRRLHHGLPAPRLDGRPIRCAIGHNRPVDASGSRDPVDTPDDRDETCPRCGPAFGCRAKEIASCPCAGVALSAAEGAYVSARFAACLCSDCLRAIQIEARRCTP